MADDRRDEIKKDLVRVFKILDRPYSRRDYGEIGAFGSRSIERVFGTWSDALEYAGLTEVFTARKETERSTNAAKEVEEDYHQRKSDLKRSHQDKRYRELQDQIAKGELLEEMIREALADAEPPIVEVHPVKLAVPKRKKIRDHITLWLDFSDLQLGTLITAEQMGGLNRHNWLIWEEKLAVWKRSVIEKIKEYATDYEVDHIVIACLGDMVEGQDIFKGQVWQVDRHVVDQAIEGANDTAAALIEIMLSFPELDFHVLEVFGNHGRTQRKGEAPYSCSMDKVYQRLVELHISNTKVRNVTYHHNEAWFYILEIYGWNHLLLHGDQGMSAMWSNRPTVNGLEKAIARYNQMLQQQIHFLHAGHFHNEWALSFNMSYLLINGSFIGTSPFSASQMVAAAPPMQTLHVFEPRVGLAKTERIYLTDGNVKTPIEPQTLAKRKGCGRDS